MREVTNPAREWVQASTVHAGDYIPQLGKISQVTIAAGQVTLTVTWSWPTPHEYRLGVDTGLWIERASA